MVSVYFVVSFIVPLCESSDFRQTSISIQTSLELLINSLYHLPRPSVSQSMDADLNPQHYRSKLTDVVKVLTTHVAQVLEVRACITVYTSHINFCLLVHRK